ncbi:hypothetical protein WA577_005638 [Blastocystis sp. JDR]
MIHCEENCFGRHTPRHRGAGNCGNSAEGDLFRGLQQFAEILLSMRASFTESISTTRTIPLRRKMRYSISHTSPIFTVIARSSSRSK